MQLASGETDGQRAWFMPSYLELLLLIAPVFLTMGLGAGVRRAGWMTVEAEGSFLRLLVNFFYPALILKSVLGNPALRDAGNLAWAPVVGFSTMAVGLVVGYYGGRLCGLRPGQGLRTFAFAVGIYNYGFIPLPLMEGLFGPESVGVLLVHNIGCELAIWSVGIMLLSGLSWREGWRKVFNPALLTLTAALVINALGWTAPIAVAKTIEWMAACAIPLGLLLGGATLAEFLDRPRELIAPRVLVASGMLRLALLPVAFLLVAKFAPLPDDLKRVVVVQAAMPSALIPIVLARHYGGQPLTAAQVIIGTTVAGLLVIPWWLKVGLAWTGL